MNARRPSSSGSWTCTCSSYAASLADDQRRLQRELVERREVGGLAGVQRELDQRGAGQQHGAVDGVVGEPRVRLEREPAGEQPLVLARHRDGGGQQRVPAAGLRRRPAPRASSAGAGRRRSAGRPARAPGCSARQSGRRPLSCACGDQRRRAPRAPARCARSAGRDRGVGDHARERGQRAVGAELEVARDALGLERADAVGEAHGLAGVARPSSRGWRSRRRRAGR